MRSLVGTRLHLALVLALLLLVGGSAGAGSSAPASGASARAFGIAVAVPGQAGGGLASVAAPPDAVAFAPGYSYGSNGEVATGSITASASASTTDATATASASAEIVSVSLFGGEVTASRIVARARANADSGAAAGDFEGATVEGLAVGGAGVAAGPGARVALGDWGYAVTLAQGSAPDGDSYRGFVTALQVVLTAEHYGLPAGTTITVGQAEATATAPELPEPTTTEGTTTSATPKPRKRPSSEAPTAGDGRTTIPPVARKPPPHVKARLTKGGYVFPVYGPASYTNTFGAARAVVGWHHGEDIFAPIGAPVLAVARGTLFSVGWNDIGGNRFWLRDTQGNEFYYAHLSAFTTLAVNGAQVQAGDVIGFVGNTGDAQTTPPHLHFEIHPLGLLSRGYDGVIDPNPWLDAWRRLTDIRLIPGSTLLPSVGGFSTAPAPGAYLLSSTDISSVSGLEPGSLRRALAEPVSAEEGGAAAGTGAP